MARGIWKGTLGFGLVTVGVELLAAEAPERLDLDLLDKRDNARIRYRKVNESTGEEVSNEAIVRGYPVGKDQYVILSDADLKAANPKASQTIEILGFVSRDEIDLIYYAKPYYVGPLKGSERAYALLRELLRQTNRVAVAQLVIRTRQYVAAVYPHESALMIHLLRYHNEIRELASEGIAKADEAAASLRPAEISMAEQLLKAMAMTWKPEEYTDTYRDDILKLVEEKAAGRRVRRAQEAPEEPRVLDLMAALKRSVAAQGKAPRGAGRRPPRARRRTARRPARPRAAARRSA